MTSIEDIAAELSKLTQKEGISVDILSDTADIVDWIPTGSVILDYILGGGIPVGRMVEIYGDESTGKSLIAAQIASMALSNGYLVLYMDAESAVSKDIFEAVGVDTDNILYTEPDTVEQVFLLMEGAIDLASKQNQKLLIVWDTIAATSSDAEMKAVVGAPVMAIHARLISQGMRKIMRKISKKDIAAVFVNQIREKIGVLFGEKTDTFGGKAPKFYASIRLKLNKSSKITVGEGKKKKVIGHQTRMEVTKNKVGPPFRNAEAFIYFGKGIDDPKTTLEYLKEQEYITGGSGGNWAIMLDEKQVKFKASSWEDVFDKYYDEIARLISNNGVNDINE